MSSPPTGVTVLLDRMAIVLRGAFNPTIFQPQWFARHEVLRPSEADEALLQIAHAQVTDFKTGWLQVQVTRDRFSAMSLNGGYEAPLCDFVIHTFGILEHSPLTALGMNREVKVQFDTVDRWHKFGHAVVPKAAWTGALNNPGLLGVRIEGSRDIPGGKVQAQIANTGERRADIDINEHRSEESGPLMAVLRDSWVQALAESARIVDHLLGLVK
jgi:hypothetical protein